MLPFCYFALFLRVLWLLFFLSVLVLAFSLCLTWAALLRLTEVSLATLSLICLHHYTDTNFFPLSTFFPLQLYPCAAAREVLSHVSPGLIGQPRPNKTAFNYLRHCIVFFSSCLLFCFLSSSEHCCAVFAGSCSTTNATHGLCAPVMYMQGLAAAQPAAHSQPKSEYGGRTDWTRPDGVVNKSLWLLSFSHPCPITQAIIP